MTRHKRGATTPVDLRSYRGVLAWAKTINQEPDKCIAYDCAVADIIVIALRQMEYQPLPGSIGELIVKESVF